MICAHPPSSGGVDSEKKIENESKTSTGTEEGANKKTRKPKFRDDGMLEVEALVTASLAEVQKLGWTNASIHSATATLGMSPAAVRMIPGGASELALRFVTRCNATLASDLASSEPFDSKPASLVATAIQKRLELITPYHHNWGSALKLIASSRSTSAGAARQSALLADEIAHYAGYRRPSAVWYADRAALAALYHATELFWVNDSTANQSATWTFLRAYAELSVGARERMGSVIDRITTAHELGTASLSALMRSMRRGY